MADEATHSTLGGGGEREAIDPVAVALALGHSGDLDPRAAAFLEKQTRVAIAQERVLHLQAEDLLREDKLRHWSLLVRHVSDVLKVTFELALSTVAIAVVVAIGAAVWMAAHDNGLVIEAFAVPPDMAARGITGQTVANAMLDKLTAMQNATDLARPAQSYANNWGNDIKVEIPNTSISVGQFYHYLASWLGHETHITGEVFRTASGLAVTARVTGSGGSTVSGSEANFDGLLQLAAENIYRQTQPFRYGVYLISGPNKRGALASVVFDKLIEGGSTLDRVWAYLAVGTRDDLGDPPRGIVENQKAAALAPDFGLPYLNLAQEHDGFSHDQAALAAARKAVELLQKDDGTYMSARSRTISLPAIQAIAESRKGDLVASLRDAGEAASLPDYSGNVLGSRETAVLDLARLHGPSAMRDAWNDLLPQSPRLIVKLQADYWSGDWSSVVAQRAAVEKRIDEISSRPPFTKAFRDLVLVHQVWPYVATALAKTGDLKAAHALIDRTPLDCDACLRNRAIIDATQGDWGGAQYWFARAVAQAPSIPLGYSEWGKMLLAKGDYDPAIAKLTLAKSKRPAFRRSAGE